jgi:hypothetical protein
MVLFRLFFLRALPVFYRKLLNKQVGWGSPRGPEQIGEIGFAFALEPGNKNTLFAGEEKADYCRFNDANYQLVRFNSDF